jgi:hypothetical protein
MSTKKDVIEFQISTEYNNHWTMRDALRELVSNGIDGQTMRREAKFGLEYDKGVLTLTNALTKLDRKSLVLGISGARADARAIGQFGEGLLIACLVMTRDNITFEIENDDERWEFFIEMGALGVPVLKAQISRGPKTGGFTVRVHGVSEALFDALVEMFLRLQPTETRNDMVKCGTSTIYMSPEQKGKVYTKGVLVQTLPDLLLGYELPDLRMNRDRASADINDINSKIVSAISRADAVDVGRIMSALSGSNGREVTLLMNNYWYFDNITNYLTTLADDQVYVTSHAEAELASNYALRPVMVEGWVAQLAHDDLKIDRRKQRFITSQRRAVLPSELSASEAAVLRLVEKQITAAGHDKPYQIMEMEAAVLGLYSSGHIYLNRSLLNNPLELLMTWTHELAHFVSLNEDTRHRDAQCYVLARMLLTRMNDEKV